MQSSTSGFSPGLFDGKKLRKMHSNEESGDTTLAQQANDSNSPSSLNAKAPLGRNVSERLSRAEWVEMQRDNTLFMNGLFPTKI
jgi:hypothetical protein